MACPRTAVSPLPLRPPPVAAVDDQPPPGVPAVGQVTALLLAARDGEASAYDRVFPIIYDQLRAMARAQLRRDGRARAGGHTLSTTALVHEAWFKLADPARLGARDRAHFLAVAARAMRQVLVESARRFRAEKRGSGAVPLALDDALVGDTPGGAIAVEQRADALVALDEALHRLSALDARLARVVELRFFGGLTEDEAAEALGITARTVRRDWVKARAWLHAELGESDAAPAALPGA